MATISAIFKDGKYRSIECPTDGTMTKVGQILLDDYTNQESTEELINRGDIFYLSGELAQGELEEKARCGDTLEKAIRELHRFNFFWNGEKWVINGVPLKVALEQFKRTE